MLRTLSRAALLLATLHGGTASAQEWSVAVGGFMTLGLGYIDADETLNNIETTVVNDAEVTFNYRLTADNGLTFGAKVEFEANGGGTNADEYVGYFEGAFGRVEIGAEDGAHDILVGGVTGGNFVSAADQGGLLFDYNQVININTQGNDTGDGLKVTYYTPTFAGFTAGVSYSPDGREGGTASSNLTSPDSRGEGVELGARYENMFGDFALRLAGGYTTFLNDANLDGENGISHDDSYTIAGEIGYAGFALGAIWGVTNLDPTVATDPDEVSAIGIGASYATGPWFFGVQYGQVLDGFSSGATAIDPFVSFEDSQGVSVEANYALAPGVTAGAAFEYAAYDDTPAGVDDDAYAFGVWLGLGF